MKIAIGTESESKITAIKDAISECIYFKGEEIELISEKVDSGIPNMGRSIEENMLGAKNRAINVSEIIEAEFYVGVEGGVFKIGKKAYLFGVVYILNNNGEGHYGMSNIMEIPEIFDKEIYENGKELLPTLLKISGDEGVYKKNGAFGHWSDDMLTRKDQFILAFLSAIPPFYNKYYKL
ncbi:MAG: inosine/xanthosine triphosphatase [Candidatus Gracilibacteria bacterium]